MRIHVYLYIKGERMRKILALIGAAAAALAGILVFLSLTNDAQLSEEESAQIQTGIEAVRALESKNVADIEKKIESNAASSAAESASAEPQASQSAQASDKKPSERFASANAMVLGDSQAESLSGYEILKDANVSAKISQRVKNSDEQINKAISANASVVFMTYGVNDMGMYSSGDEFAEEYAKKLEKLKSGLPDAEIYVTSVFPASDSAAASNPSLSRDILNDYNAALKSKSESMGVTYIDCSGIVEEQYYEPDGQHFKYKMYVKWANFMADSAGL